MRKWTKMILVLMLCAITVIGMGCAKSTGGSGGEIKIGLIFSKTGATAITEECMYNAAMMAVDEVNAAGGVNGKKLVPIFEDYSTDPAKAADKMKKLIMQDQVVATVGLYTSASRVAARPIVEQNNGLLVYPTFYEGEDPSPNIIYTGTVLNQQNDLFVPWLMENVGKKFFFLGSETVYVSLIHAQAVEVVKANGGEIVGNEIVPSGNADFASVIAKIKEADPDVIYANLNGDSTVAFYKQYKSFGFDSKTMPIASTITDEASVAAIGDAAVGHYSCFNYFNTIDSEANKVFVDNYEKKYGNRDVTAVGEASYDSVMLLAKALEKAADYKPETIIKAFEGLEFDAPQGPIKVDPSSHHIWCRGRIAQVAEDGTFKVVYESSEMIEPKP
jgi:branched-chain amino acid transport system substrate-binding protein/urea transport system substrate-binding protein